MWIVTLELHYSLTQSLIVLSEFTAFGVSCFGEGLGFTILFVKYAIVLSKSLDLCVLTTNCLGVVSSSTLVCLLLPIHCRDSLSVER